MHGCDGFVPPGPSSELEPVGLDDPEALEALEDGELQVEQEPADVDASSESEEGNMVGVVWK